jgi:hypothetical protein
VVTIEVDVVEADDDVIEVEDGSVEVDVVGGMIEVVVESTEPVEEQVLNTSDAAMAAPMNSGGRLAPPNPNDLRRGFTGLPQIPRTRSNPTRPRTSAPGECFRNLISLPIYGASSPGTGATTARLRVATVHYPECRIRRLTQS